MPQPGIRAAVPLLVAVLAVAYTAGLPNRDQAPSEVDLAILLAATSALVLLATALARFRPRRTWLQLGDIKAQSHFRFVARRLAPPAVAGALAVSQTGRIGDAGAVFAAMLLVSVASSGTRYPLHLSGVARFAFDLLMPAAGISLALVVATVWDVRLDGAALAAPLLGAWFVTFAGGWLEEAFNAERPVRMAVIGEPVLAGALAVEMEAANVRDHNVVGWVSGAGGDADGDRRYLDAQPTDPGLKWLGSVDQIRSVVLESEIDLLVMAPSGGTAIDLFQDTVERCVDLPVRMVQASRLYEEMYGRVPIGAINAAWFAYIMHPNFSAQTGWSKRLMDTVVAGVLIVILAPFLLMLATAVKLGDRGPVFFRQRRVGARGEEFGLMKFRTMNVDAERPGEARWAQADDPRTTRVGRFLRRTHLDELPQLLNVLRGDMSLVGPRPERPEFVSELEQKIPYYSRRVLVKPGITGWAQVRSGYSGSEAGTAYKVCHDLYYIKHRSLLFDLLTMIETVRTLVADVQYGQFTFSEAFTFGDAEVSQEAQVLGARAVLGDTADLAGGVDGLSPARISKGHGDPTPA